jgi:hypothetical protein
MHTVGPRNGGGALHRSASSRCHQLVIFIVTTVGGSHQGLDGNVRTAFTQVVVTVQGRGLVGMLAYIEMASAVKGGCWGAGHGDKMPSDVKRASESMSSRLAMD